MNLINIIRSKWRRNIGRDYCFSYKLEISGYFFIWWWSSVWGDQEQWNVMCVCYLGISVCPGEPVHSWWRKLFSFLLLVCKQTAWGLLACCMEPATGLGNNWHIFHLVFHMSEHRKKLSHLEELYSNDLIIPNSNKLKSWIGSAIQVCLSYTGQQSTADKFEHKSSLLCHVLCFTKLCGKLIALYVENSFFWRTECLWKWKCFMF